MAELYPATTPIKVDVVGGTSTPDGHRQHIEGQSTEFQSALARLEHACDGFLKSAIQDAGVRADYMQKTRDAAEHLMRQVESGALTPHEGAQAAHALRNEILRLSRADLTTFGLAISRGIKPDGRPLGYFEEKYAQQDHGRSFEQLQQSEQEAIWRKIIDKAGNPNGKVTRIARLYGHAGRVLLVMSLAIAVYSVANAEDKTRESAKQTADIGTSIAGGVAAGAAVGLLVSNPAGWVVGVAIFVGAAAAGYSTETLFDYYWPER